ncbi:MAG: DNA polymerase III subunit delta, partial [Candidatus Aureabacteria bacterium]|nr:DNA polymerase III subunit delta [Candidatus Auribacterota bacterium]
MRPKEFGQMIKKGECPPVVFFLGDEDYWKGLYIRTLCSRLFKNNESTLNFFVLSASNIPPPEVTDQANELGFFGSKRLIHYKHIDELDSEEAQCLVRYVKSPNPDTVLILDTDEPELPKSMSLVTEIPVAEVLFIIGKNNRAELKDFIAFRLRELGNLTLERGLEEDLMEAFPANLRLLSSNLEKMAAHRNYLSPLTRKDFLVVSPLLGEINNFVFLDAVVEKKLSAALQIKTHLSRNKELVFPLVGLLRSQFEKLLTAKEMKKQQMASKEIESRCRISVNSWAREKFWRQCDHLSEEELNRKYSLIAQCDYQLKTSGIS